MTERAGPCDVWRETASALVQPERGSSRANRTKRCQRLIGCGPYGILYRALRWSEGALEHDRNGVR